VQKNLSIIRTCRIKNQKKEPNLKKMCVSTLSAPSINNAFQRLLNTYFESKSDIHIFDKISITPDELRWILSKIRIDTKIIGCGGWGLNTIGKLADTGIYGAVKCVCDTDAIDLFRAKADKKILIGENVTKGMGTNASIELAEKALDASKEDIKQFLIGSKLVFVIACYGGGVGTKVSQFVASTAKKSGALVLGVAALPHSGETPEKLKVATTGIEQFINCCDLTLTVPVEKIFKILPDIECKDAYNITTNIAVEMVKHLLEIVIAGTPSFMRIDYFDFQTLVKESGLAFVTLGESSGGEERARQAVEDALKSPFITAKALSSAEGLILSIVSDPGVSEAEITDVVSLISERTNPATKTLVNFSYNPLLEETARAFILLTGIGKVGV
jgi:cell division protein FtsZ